MYAKMDYNEIEIMYLYFVKFEIEYEGENVIVFKIGRTHNLNSRLETLKVEFNIKNSFTLLLAIQIMSTKIETNMLQMFIEKYPHLKFNFKIRDILKTECFKYNDIFIIRSLASAKELDIIKEDYFQQTKKLFIENIKLEIKFIQKRIVSQQLLNNNILKAQYFQSLGDVDNMTKHLHNAYKINNNNIKIYRFCKNKVKLPIIDGWILMQRVSAPIEGMINDSYNHEEIKQMSNTLQLLPHDSYMSYLINYYKITKDTTIKKIRTKTNTLTKLNVNEIKFYYFQNNSII